MAGQTNVGFGNRIISERIVAIIHVNSAPIKRLITDARDDKKLIDVSFGRKSKSAVVLDTGQVVLSSLAPETISARICKEDAGKDIE